MGIKDVANFFHMNSKDGHPLWESMEIQNLISNQSFTNLLKKRCNILYVSLKDNGQHQLYKNPTYTPKHIRHRNGAIWIKYSLLMLLFNRNYSLFSSLFSLLIYFVKITFGFHCTNLNNVAFDESSGQEFFTWLWNNDAHYSEPWEFHMLWITTCDFRYQSLSCQGCCGNLHYGNTGCGVFKRGVQN